MDLLELSFDHGARRRVLAPDLESDVNCAAAIGVPVLISAGADVAEWLARLIHDRSDRRSHPFVVFRPGRGDQLSLLRPTIDGSRPVGGTLFVADVAAAEPQMQGLLRHMLSVPQPDPRMPFRLIAGTAADLFSLVVSGEFDDLLFYRLNKIHIRPAIRHDGAREAPIATGGLLPTPSGAPWRGTSRGVSA